MPDIAINFLPIVLRPDPARTVIRPFLPSDPPAFAVEGHPRPGRIIERVLSMDEDALERHLVTVEASLDERHRDVDALLLRRFDEVAQYVPDPDSVSRQHRLFIGAYLSAEYSFESAALFNPSAVPAPDQSGVAEGDLRFLISLRGIGEGHLSSVTFRTGTWHADDTITMDEPSPTAVAPTVVTAEDEREDGIIELDCAGSRDPSETVLFPIVASQERGIEDVRLTPFDDGNGRHTYAGTFTGLGAEGITQQTLQTDDFRRFRMRSIAGPLSESKGLALFPRKVGGRWLGIGRQDNENLWLASSDDLITWNADTKIMGPEAPWEFVQIGNCGSPLEIDEGWLLLTHGVGVVRNYCMGAALLDKDDPSNVIGRLADPLLQPDDSDRDGYVPNVVYSCGGIVRGRRLLLPYGVADNYARFATVDLDTLVAAMR